MKNYMLYGWLIVIAIAIVIDVAASFLIGFWLSLIAYPLVVGITLLATFRSVASGEVILTTVFQKYYRTLQSGGNFLAPFFESEDAAASTKEEEYQLFAGDEGSVKIDFVDTSASVKAKFLYVIEDASLAVYGVANVLPLIADKLENKMRAELTRLEVDEANEQKETISDTIADRKFINKIRKDWGIRITTVLLIDIILSEVDLAKRREVMELEKEEEKTEIQKRIAVKKAEIKEQEAIGDKHGIVEKGKGLADQVAQMKKQIPNADNAASYLANIKKWEAIENNPNAVIIEGANGAVNKGLGFGIGHGISSKKGVKP